MSIRTRWLAPSLMVFAAASLIAQQPERIDSAMNAKIRTEGLDHSKIMWIEHYLTDVYGPRPIGSPNHVAAANWAVKTMTSWGMKNAHLEPFTWRGVGWLPGKASGFITSPVKANIKFEAVPWSPSTKGTVSGEVISIVAPETPTEEEFTAYLAPLASKVKGGIVMVGAAAADAVVAAAHRRLRPTATSPRSKSISASPLFCATTRPHSASRRKAAVEFPA